MRFASGFVLVMCLVGCGNRPEFGSSYEADAVAGHKMEMKRAPEAIESKEEGKLAETADPTQNIERKIVYTADLTIVVDDIVERAKQLNELAEEYDGYRQDIDENNSSRTRRRGRYVVRIPLKNYQAFLAAIQKLGYQEQFQQSAEDVSMSYYDLQARLDNAKASKERLEKLIERLIEKKSESLKNELDAQKSMDEVQEKIETYEAQFRVLENRVSMTTVTVNLREEIKYVPVRDRSLFDRIDNAWTESTQGVVDFAEGLVIAVVFLFPWLVIFGVIGIFVFSILRARQRTQQLQPPHVVDRTQESVSDDNDSKE